MCPQKGLVAHRPPVTVHLNPLVDQAGMIQKHHEVISLELGRQDISSPRRQI